MTYASVPMPAFPFTGAPTSTGWERMLVVLGGVLLIILTTHSFQFLFADEVTDGLSNRATARDNPLYLMVFGAQFGLFLLLLIYTTLSRGISWGPLAGLAICLFVALSSLWSVNARTTLMHAVVFSYLVVAAYVLSVHLRPRDFVRLYFWVSVFILVSSFVLLAVAPDMTGELRYGGGWLIDRQFNGVMSSKNLAGFVFASAYVIALQGRLIGISMLVRLPVMLLSLVAIVLTNSATAVLVVALLTPASIILTAAGVYRRVLTMALVLVAFAAILAMPFASFGAALGILGRDATFTGRTHLWQLAMENIADRPVLGFGYFGFFDAGAFSPAWQFWDQFVYFLTDTFHNSAMDLTVSLGLVGLGIMIVVTVTAATIPFNRTTDEEGKLLLALLLTVFLIGGTMENTIMHHNYVATLILFYTAFAALRRYAPSVMVVRPIAPTPPPTAATRPAPPVARVDVDTQGDHRPHRRHYLA